MTLLQTAEEPSQNSGTLMVDVSGFRNSNVELRIAPFMHVSHFTRHGLWCRRIFSILVSDG